MDTSNPNGLMYVEYDGPRHLATLVLNRPEKRNALNWAMFEQLSRLLDEIHERPSLRGLVVRSKGDFFSAGIDLQILNGTDPTAPKLDLTGPKFRFMMKNTLQQFFTKLESLEIPTFAVVDGYCIGSGFELILACDFRLATERAVFQMKESHLGILPDLGGITRLARLVSPAHNKEICLLGSQISAREGLRMGFLNYVCPSLKAVNLQLDRMVGDLNKAGPLPVGMGKSLINQISGINVQQGLDAEAQLNSILFGSRDFRTAAKAALTKAPFDWRGE